MKKYLASATLLAGFSGTAFADDSVTVNGVTLYGQVDVGVTYQTHGVPNSPWSSAGTEYLISKNSNSPIFAVAPNGLGNSRIGIKGIEDFGDGWSGLFKLETGFNPASGQLSDGIHSVVAQNGIALANQTTSADSSRAGQVFNQAAYVGISNSKYGALTLGRQTTLEADSVSAYDPQQGSYAFSVIGYSGTAGGSGATEDLRLDNSIKYLGAYGPFRLGLMYQPGGTITRDDSALEGDIGYQNGPLSVDAVAAHKKDEVAAGSLSVAQAATLPHNSITGTVSDNTSFSLMGKYSLEKIKFFAGYEYIKFTNPKSPLAAGAIDIGGYDISVVNNTAYTNNKILQYAWIGARYKLLDTVELAAAYYHIDQNGYRLGSAGGGCSSTIAATCSGQENAVSLMVNYHASKRVDLYAGAMYSQNIDGLANGYIHNNTIDPTIGTRFVF